MGSLHDFFRALAQFVVGSVVYLVKNFASNDGYREGFVAGIVFVIFGVLIFYGLPYARARTKRYFAVRAPSLRPGEPPYDIGCSCLGWGLVLLFVTLLVLGILWGLI